MKKYLFWIGAGLLLISLALAQNEKEKKKTIVQKKSALTKNLSGLKGKMEKLGTQIKAKKEVSHKLEGDIDWVDDQQSKIQDKLDLTRDRLLQTKREQSQIVRQLDAETKKLAVVKHQVSNRLRSMYMTGNETLLAVLIGSKSLGDFAARKTLVERIGVRDNQLFRRAGEVRDQVILKKKEKEAAIEHVGKLNHALKNDLEEMQAIKKKKRDLLAQAEKEKSILEDEYDSLADESKQIEKEIQAFQAKLGGGMGGAIFSGRLRAPVNARITSGFGSRYHPILHKTRMHTGVDFGASAGTTISAAGSGVVILAGRKGGFGNCVIIDHGGGISTLYGHCSRIFVSGGQKVSQGQRIAAVGSTGLATGPHLHFEVRVHGTPVNPMGRF